MHSRKEAVSGVNRTEGGTNLDEIHLDQSGPPAGTVRRGSFSNTLNKLTDKANPFGHRRRMTTAALPKSDSLGPTSFAQPRQSRLPTPSGLPLNSSCFGSLNSFVTSNIDENTNPETSAASSARHYRRVSDKFIQLPFFSRENQLHIPQRPLSRRTKRESSIRIEHRGLMAPIQPAPMPRSSTMGNVTQQHDTTVVPRFMCSTSNSASRRRQSLNPSQHFQPPKSRYTSNGTTLLQSPAAQSPGNDYRRRSLKSPPAKKWESLSASSSAMCFSIRKDGDPLRANPPVRAPSPAVKPSRISQKEATTHQSTLPLCPKLPPRTRIAMPEVSSPVPENEHCDEDDRDKAATYTRAQFRLDADDGGEMTATEDSDDANMLFRVVCNRSILDEAHNQASSDFQIQPQVHFEEQSPGDASVNVNPTQYFADSDNLCYVHEAKPPTFWLGRLTSLSDRFRTECLSLSPCSSTPSFTYPASLFSYSITPARSPIPAKMQHDNARIFGHLHKLCTTEEARTSLDQFKVEYEAKYGVDGERREAGTGKGQRRVSSSMMAGKEERKKMMMVGKGWLKAFKGRGR